jgi:succinate dehydrogenase/fumarate reductase flavoprotein subunit
MDIRQYYERIKEVAGTIQEEYTIVKSLATEDGGKAGVFTEVSRNVAAKLIVDRKAILATPGEAKEYRLQLQAAEAARRELEERNRNVIQVFARAGLDALRSSFGIEEEGC